jgi:hypothetical protein
MAPLARAIVRVPAAPAREGARWVEPKLVARVEFAEWTADGNLRAPSYKGLDLDADPGVAVERPRPSDGAAAKVAVDAAAVRGVDASGRAGRGGHCHVDARAAAPEPDRASPDELAALDVLPAKGGQWSVGGRQLKLSNLDKVLWPADGITKRDLIRYYATIAPYLLPYLRDRALTLQRYPDGIERAGFWQKQVPGHAPEWVECWPWTSASRASRRSICWRIPWRLWPGWPTRRRSTSTPRPTRSPPGPADLGARGHRPGPANGVG